MLKFPSGCRAGISEKHPNIKAKWEKEDGKYEKLALKQNGKKNERCYILQPVPWKKVKLKIAADQLPASVPQYITQHK